MKPKNAKPTGPSQPAVEGQTAQTGNTGTPLQVENVQYNMKMRAVQSKIGLYSKLANAGLWLTAIFTAYFLATLVDSAGGQGEDLGEAAVLQISLLIVSVPVFVVAHLKREKDLAVNPELSDDLFFKKSVRRNLSLAVFLTAAVLFGAIFNTLSKLFLDSGDTIEGTTIANFFIFTLAFAAVLAYNWRLHRLTKR